MCAMCATGAFRWAAACAITPSPTGRHPFFCASAATRPSRNSRWSSSVLSTTLTRLTPNQGVGKDPHPPTVHLPACTSKTLARLLLLLCPLDPRAGHPPPPRPRGGVDPCADWTQGLSPHLPDTREGVDPCADWTELALELRAVGGLASGHKNRRGS